MMIRSSAFALLAVSVVAVACVAPSDREGLGRSSSAIEELLVDVDVTDPLVEFPEVPPGGVYPGWGSCSETGSRAPRAFVRVDPAYRGKADPCPTVKGEYGAWFGTPVASTDSGYCSYVWREEGFSEFFRIPSVASATSLHRSAYEGDPRNAAPIPSDAGPAARCFSIPERRDIRPDCMPKPSPCIFNGTGFGCLPVIPTDDVAISSAHLEKGMSPCGACGELLPGLGSLLVVLPDWFAKTNPDDQLHIDIFEVGADADSPGPTVRRLSVWQPKGEQAFVVPIKGVKSEQKIFVSR